MDDDQAKTQFNVIRGRILKPEHQSLPTKTIAIVRVHANEKSPTVTKEQLENLSNTNEINFRTQYDACSHGQLEWTLEQKRASLTTISTSPGGLWYHRRPHCYGCSQSILDDLNSTDVRSLGDRVMFCAPRGPGSWVDAASANHWHVQFHDEWCLSLTRPCTSLVTPLDLRIPTRTVPNKRKGPVTWQSPSAIRIGPDDVLMSKQPRPWLVQDR
jgi:hypothetical protein